MMAHEQPQSEQADLDVDWTLIYEMLKMSPQQRLEQHDRALLAVMELKAAYRASIHARPTHADSRKAG